ncbi:MAG: hypothetical protein ACFCU1_10950 [Sumerlaeia bacterium]
MGIMIPLFLVLGICGGLFFGVFLIIIYGSLYVEKWFWDGCNWVKSWWCAKFVRSVNSAGDSTQDRIPPSP